MAEGKRREEFQTEREGYKVPHPPTSLKQEQMKKTPPVAKGIEIAKPKPQLKDDVSNQGDENPRGDSQLWQGGKGKENSKEN